jgi:hypothetical protein
VVVLFAVDVPMGFDRSKFLAEMASETVELVRR